MSQKPIGSYAFELSIKTYLKGYKITEFPLNLLILFLISSTFKLGPWVKEYLKMVYLGFKNKNR